MFDEEEFYRGKVIYWKKEGYGFIRSELEELPDVYIHYTQIEPHREGFKTLIEGDLVEFQIYKSNEGHKEQYRAKNLRIVR